MHIIPGLRTPRQQDLKNKMKIIKQYLLVRALSENMEYVLFDKEEKKRISRISSCSRSANNQPFVSSGAMRKISRAMGSAPPDL